MSITLGGNKFCPCCNTIGRQVKIDTEYYLEYQMYCPACRFFERFRLPKTKYECKAPIGMASAFYDPRIPEYLDIQRQIDEKIGLI